ncbi:signal peptidase I [Candidatus Microgenomates bacterium]|nr:signal peptidase I [Candidatus Microgenomates bacterium]
MNSLGKFLFDVLQTVALSLAIFAAVYLFVLSPHQVKGRSMEPNFVDGEYLLTEKISYRFGNPQQGDVIIFAAPPDKKSDYIKRIIGLPGDKVSLHNGKVSVNGKELAENYLPSDIMTFGGQFLADEQQITVPASHYFVLGDNRPHSSDSRIFGTISRNDIVGKAWLVYWPLPEVKLIKQLAPL